MCKKCFGYALIIWFSIVCSALPQALLDKVIFWEAKNDDVRLRQSLTQLFRVLPDNPLGLRSLIRLEIRDKNFDEASWALQRLRQWPKQQQNHQRLKAYLALMQKNPEALKEARLLAKGGRAQTALSSFSRLFPNGGPTPQIELEIASLQSKLKINLDKSRYDLENLHLRYPDNLTIELTWLDFQAQYPPITEALLRRLHQLSFANKQRNTISQIWRDAIANLSPLLDNKEHYLQYLAQYPQDLYIRQQLSQNQKSYNLALVRAGDPYYQAKLKGLTALANNQLAKAEALLRKALFNYPDDPQIIGGLGYVLRRRGQHVAAQRYFKSALAKDPDNQKQWLSLINSSDFWGLKKQIDNSLDRAEKKPSPKHLALTKSLIREAMAINDKQPLLWVSQAKLAALSGLPKTAKLRYQQALLLDPNNESALRGLVNLYIDKGDLRGAKTVLGNLSQGQQAVLSNYINNTEASLLREQADIAIASHRNDSALKLLEKAIALQPDSIWIYYDLAKLFSRMQFDPAGLQLFAQLSLEQPVKAQFHYAYALYLSSINQAKAAINQIEHIDQQYRSLNETRLYSRLVFNDAMSQIKQSSSRDLRQQWLAIASAQLNNDLERTLDLAQVLEELGDHASAVQLLNSKLPPQSPNNASNFDLQVAYAELYLISNAEFQLVQHLQTMATKFNQAEQRMSIAGLWLDLAQRQTQVSLLLLEQIYKAYQSLLPQTVATSGGYWLGLGDFYQDLDHDQQALLCYQHAALIGGDSLDAKLTLALAYLKSGQAQNAEIISRQLLQLSSQLNADEQEQLAQLLIDLDNAEQAKPLLLAALQGDEDNPQLWYQLAEIAYQQRQDQQAKEHYQKALDLELIKRGRIDVATNSQQQALARLGPNEEWAVKRLRNRLIDLQEKTNGHIWIAADWNQRSATEGQSTMRSLTIPMELSWPSRTGHAFVRIEPVHLDAGKVDINTSDAEEFGSVLLCNGLCPTNPIKQIARGTSYALGYRSENLRWDIGTTPLGFEVEDWVAGVEGDWRWQQLSLSAEFSRRPVTSSLLSFAGTTDPNTGRVWGGIRSTGAKLSFSWDEGGQFGLYGAIGGHQITGKNVANNTRWRTFNGIYTTLRDIDPFRIDTGATISAFSFSHDLGEFTFGQGGYYSPQSYLSLSVPISLYGRVNRFAYQLRATVSKSWSKDDDSDYFPDDKQLQNQALRSINSTDVNPIFSGGSGSGIGYSVKFIFEYQLANTLYFGGKMAIQRSEFYQPNSAMLWLRYQFEPTLLAIPTPPRAIVPYADF